MGKFFAVRRAISFPSPAEYSPPNPHGVQPGGEGAPEARVAGVAVDGREVVLTFAVKTRADAPHFVRAGRVDRLRRFLIGVDAKRSASTR